MRDIKAAKPIECDYLGDLWLREKKSYSNSVVIHKVTEQKKRNRMLETLFLNESTFVTPRWKLLLITHKPSLLIGWFMRSFILSLWIYNVKNTHIHSHLK